MNNTWNKAKRVYDAEIRKNKQKSNTGKKIDKNYKSDGNKSRQTKLDNLEIKAEKIDGSVTKYMNEIKSNINEKICT